jgi:hypothetical protein
MPNKNTHKTVTVTPERIFIYALGVGAVGGAVYFAREYYLGLKAQQNGNADTRLLDVVNSNPAPAWGGGSAAVVHNDNFPLKRGSWGNRVTLMQQALSKTLADKFSQYTGIDGQFGPGTEKALLAAGYSSTIDEPTFNTITGGSGSSSSDTGFNAAEIAASLYQNANSKNSNGVINALKQIRNTSDYTAVNTLFKSKGFISRTIVTDLLDDAFPYDEAARTKIKAEFFRIGLKQDKATFKWSLSGLSGIRDVMTMNDTIIMDANKNRIPVRRNTILGDEMKSENGLTCFKAIDGSVGLVPTRDIKYL